MKNRLAKLVRKSFTKEVPMTSMKRSKQENLKD